LRGILNLLFKDEQFYNRPDNAQQKHNNCNCINGMHYLKVKAGGPVWIFFPEKIHKQIYGRLEVKAKRRKQKAFCFGL